MSNEITPIDNAPNLPAEVSIEIRMLSTSPAKYLEALPIEKADAERPPGAIMLSQYKRSLDRGKQLMYLSMMIAEVNDFFNVKGNMNAKQIRLTAELILENDCFFDLTLGNIKACFRQNMMTARLYDRLDGNIIIGWLREFKSEMADWCEIVKLGNDNIREREETETDAGAITHATYMAMLKERANDGDKEASGLLAEYQRRSRIPSPEEQRRKEFEFLRYKEEYVKRKRAEKAQEQEDETHGGAQYP